MSTKKSRGDQAENAGPQPSVGGLDAKSKPLTPTGVGPLPGREWPPKGELVPDQPRPSDPTRPDDSRPAPDVP